MERSCDFKLVRIEVRYKENRYRLCFFFLFLLCVGVCVYMGCVCMGVCVNMGGVYLGVFMYRCVCICMFLNEVGGRVMGIDNEVVCNLLNLVLIR